MVELQLEGSDAWLLLAIGYAAKHRAGSLADVIGVADGIQHVLPTVEEINGAVGRLTRAGYLVGLEAGQLKLTESGRALVDQIDTGGGNVFDKLDRLRQLIGAPRWTPDHDPTRAQRGERDVVTAADYTKALAAYGDALKRR